MPASANQQFEHLTRCLLNSFQISLEAVGRSPRTIEHYLWAARNFAAFCTREHLPEPQRCTREHVELWLRDLRLRDLSSHSVQTRYTALRAFFRWLEEEDELEHGNPMTRIPRPRVDEVLKDVVAEEDLVKVFRHLERAKRWRDASVIALLYDTGMRAGELLALNVDDLDLRSGIIAIRRSKSRRPRMVRLSKGGLVYVDRYLRRRDDAHNTLIVGRKGRFTRSGLYQLVKRIFREIGVEGIGPHDLRHTSASHAVSEMDESAMMELYGWRSSEMVRHHAQQRLQQAALEAHKRASPLERLQR